MTTEERFWNKVNKTNDCWLWMGAKNQNGYGLFCIHNQKSKSAHIFVWELINGRIPKRNGKKKLLVCHKCDTPNCVNPSHLFLGTNKANQKDAMYKERKAKKLTKENVIFIRSSPLQNAQLSKMFSVANGTIGRARQRKSWKWIK